MTATTDARPLALLRIGAGILVLADLIDRLNDFHAFYTAGGLALGTRSVMRASHLALGNDPKAVLGLYLLGFVPAVALLLGLFTRAATVATFLQLVSLHHRNPWVDDGGDAVLRALLFWLSFADCGARFSLDVRLGRRPRSDRIPAAPIWLLQAQIASIYLAAAAAKTGIVWREGTALHEILSAGDWARGWGPWLADQPRLCRLLTRASWVIEGSFAPLVLLGARWPIARAPALVGGVLLHLGIFATMRIGIFSQVMPLSYLAFMPAWQVRSASSQAPRTDAAWGAGLRAQLSPSIVFGLGTLACVLAGQGFAFAEKPLPRPLFALLETFGLRQDFRVFAPDGPFIDVQFRAPGQLSDGRTVELTESVLAPLRTTQSFRYRRWHRVRTALAFSPPALLEALGRMVCARHNTGRDGASLVSFELRALTTFVGQRAAPLRDELRMTQMCMPLQR